MNLRQMTGLGRSKSTEKKAPQLPNSDRVLTLVVEGAALGIPEVDVETYKEFRTNVAKLALQLSDRLPEDEMLAQVRLVLHEFESYRSHSETELRNRSIEWRAAISLLFRELLGTLGIDASAPDPSELLRMLASTISAQGTRELHQGLEAFLHPAGAESAPAEASKFRTADHSTESNNAAGLPGRGSAIEHVKRLIESGDKAFIVLFRLSCLNMINQRFGPEAVEDCLMAVSAFLTQSLNSDDAIYHWSDSSLLAILQGRANQQILTAELERIVMQNRETTVTIGGRAIVLRIPITSDLTPIERLKTADDLYKITLLSAGGRTR
jgi:GGDEF domain-containing protein